MSAIEHGDCREVLARMASAGVQADSCLTDPPYHLTSIVKRFGAANAAPAQQGSDGRFARASRGFMGKQWDGGDVAFRPETWALVFAVMKPGAHLLAFAGTRTYHRMACAIEDAGFEVRDQIGWLYGSGFPKSHNLDGEWEGWGTALKPAWEPICVARKPLIGTVAANALAHRTGAINIDGCRIETDESLNGGTYSGELRDPGPQRCLENRNRKRGIGEYAQPSGRWPANVIHDGSDEVIAAFPYSDAGSGSGSGSGSGGIWSPSTGKPAGATYGDGGGSAARFFYTAKATSEERTGSKHPTVKPLALMRYLCRLVTPPGGTVLDPFAGTGTTGIAAAMEGFDSLLIEREDEYVADIRRRFANLSGAAVLNPSEPTLFAEIASA